MSIQTAPDSGCIKCDFPPINKVGAKYMPPPTTTFTRDLMLRYIIIAALFSTVTPATAATMLCEIAGGSHTLRLENSVTDAPWYFTSSRAIWIDSIDILNPETGKEYYPSAENFEAALSVNTNHDAMYDDGHGETLHVMANADNVAPYENGGWSGSYVLDSPSGNMKVSRIDFGKSASSKGADVQLSSKNPLKGRYVDTATLKMNEPLRYTIPDGYSQPAISSAHIRYIFETSVNSIAGHGVDTDESVPLICTVAATQLTIDATPELDLGQIATGKAATGEITVRVTSTPNINQGTITFSAPNDADDPDAYQLGGGKFTLYDAKTNTIVKPNTPVSITDMDNTFRVEATAKPNATGPAVTNMRVDMVVN